MKSATEIRKDLLDFGEHTVFGSHELSKRPRIRSSMLHLTIRPSSSIETTTPLYRVPLFRPSWSPTLNSMSAISGLV